MVGADGFEPPTSTLHGKLLYQLAYAPSPSPILHNLITIRAMLHTEY